MQADDFAATEQNPPHEIAEPLLDGEVEPDSSGPETMASPDSGNYLDSTLSFSGRGTGDAKLSKPSLSSAITPLFSILGSLLIVLACFMILMMLMKKISPKGNRNLPPEVFEDLGRTFLTQKLQLHLLKLGNRLILVSVTQDGVTPITEITDPDEVVPLIGMCRGQDTGSASGLFKRTLSELSKGDRDGYFGEDVQTAKPAKAVSKPATKAAKPASPAKSTLLDLYSEPDESLAEILASGLGTKGAKHA